MNSFTGDERVRLFQRLLEAWAACWARGRPDLTPLADIHVKEGGSFADMCPTASIPLHRFCQTPVGGFGRGPPLGHVHAQYNCTFIHSSVLGLLDELAVGLGLWWFPLSAYDLVIWWRVCHTDISLRCLSSNTQPTLASPSWVSRSGVICTSIHVLFSPNHRGDRYDDVGEPLP
jgi:hypothetical protein